MINFQETVRDAQRFFSLVSFFVCVCVCLNSNWHFFSTLFQKIIVDHACRYWIRNNIHQSTTTNIKKIIKKSWIDTKTVNIFFLCVFCSSLKENLISDGPSTLNLASLLNPFTDCNKSYCYIKVKSFVQLNCRSKTAPTG